LYVKEGIGEKFNEEPRGHREKFNEEPRMQ
jgi:hypothetical protein